MRANSAKQRLSRFTSCVLRSGVELPYKATKSNIADSLTVVIQIERRPGHRFISEVLEINMPLPEGLPPEEVVRDIAKSRAHEKHDPEDYARRTVTKAQAELRNGPHVGLAKREDTTEADGLNHDL